MTGPTESLSELIPGHSSQVPLLSTFSVAIGHPTSPVGTRGARMGGPLDWTGVQSTVREVQGQRCDLICSSA